MPWKFSISTKVTLSPSTLPSLISVSPFSDLARPVSLPSLTVNS